MLVFPVATDATSTILFISVQEYFMDSRILQLGFSAFIIHTFTMLNHFGNRMEQTLHEQQHVEGSQGGLSTVLGSFESL